ncbi:MAG: alkaline phosphatase family protein [bacterium]
MTPFAEERRANELNLRVDEARSRLRELGYLRNPIESFVVGRPHGGIARALAGVATRLGLVGGALVSLLVWLATIAMNPAIVDAPRDLALLAIYLFGVYFVAVFGVGFATGGALVAWRRASHRASAPPRLAYAIGALATALALLYGTLWWRWNRFAPTEAGLASHVNILAGLLIVLVALLLGRLARLSTILLLDLQANPRATLAPRGRTDTIRTLAIGVTASALFFVYLSATGVGGRRESLPPTPFEIAAPARPVVIIGIDGLSWTDVVYLAKRGDVPHLAELLNRSARAPLAESIRGEPPELWTTIATGVSAERHGVNAFVLSRPAGMRAGVSMPDSPFGVFSAVSTVLPHVGLSHEVPVSGLTRRMKTVWEILAEKNVPTAVVNWWATWPADAGPGTVVSERAFARLSNTRDASEDLERTIAPASLGSIANALAKDAVAATASEAGGLPPHLVSSARLAQAGDLFAIGMAESLLAASGGAGLVAVYLPGLDILRRPLLAENGGTPDLPALDTRLETLRAHARVVDTGVGRLLARAPQEACIALIVTPGARAGENAGDQGGLFALAGPVARPEYRAAAIRPEEIAPTLLAAIGCPTSRELDGRARTDFLREDALLLRPLVEIESFGERGLPEVTASAYDEEFLERLRSLGYIE